jgi:hypothetical protein
MLKEHYRDLDDLVINYIKKLDDVWVYQDMSEFANTANHNNSFIENEFHIFFIPNKANVIM